MRRIGLRLILTILLLALAAFMCWLAQPALAPSDSGVDSTEQPPAPTTSSDGARLIPFSHTAAALSGMMPRGRAEHNLIADMFVFRRTKRDSADS